MHSDFDASWDTLAVVEALLKGSGMHWARPHVDPMLALRNIASNDRWDEA